MIKKVKEFLFQNRTAKQTVAKNTVWLVISNYGGRLIKVIIIIYAARVLDTAGYGVFSYAVTLSGFVGIFLDPGVNSILIRDISRSSEEERKKVFATTFVVKTVLVILGALLIIFIAPLFSTLPGTKALLPLVACMLSFDTFREFFSSLLRGREKMEWDAGIFLLTNAAIVVFGFIFLLHSATAASFAWAYTLGTAVGGLTAFIVAFPYLRQSISSFSRKLVMPLIRAAWPFAVIGALGLLLTNMDVLIISWMRTASDVGIYSAVLRIIQTIYLIPGIIQMSTLPALARLAKGEQAKFRAAFERTLGFIFLASVPLAFGGIVLSSQVMSLVFGSAYVVGGNALRVLMVSMVFDFPASVIAAAIFAYEHQKGLIVSSAIAGIANVVFDLILIPRFGITGSAFATLGAQILSNWYLWSMMKKINRFTAMNRLGKIVVAGAAMFVVAIALLFAGVNVIVNVIICSAVYGGLLYLLREPLLYEVKLILFSPAAAITQERL